MRHGCRLLIALAFAAFAGCATAPRPKLPEEQTQYRDSQFRDALAEVMRTGPKHDALAADKDSARQGVDVPAQPLVHYISLGRLTGGLDRDGAPGDEILSVVVVPFDHSARVIESIGTLRVTAEQAFADGSKTIGEWIVPSDKLSAAWKKGLLDPGYHFEFPWQTPPSREQIRVVARLTTADGRTFETAKELRVRVATAGTPAGSVEPVVRVGHQAISVGRPLPLGREVIAPPPPLPPPALVP